MGRCHHLPGLGCISERPLGAPSAPDGRHDRGCHMLKFVPEAKASNGKQEVRTEKNDSEDERLSDRD